MDPSPTADATRLILPARTSPTANTPGKLGRTLKSSVRVLAPYALTLLFHSFRGTG